MDLNQEVTVESPLKQFGQYLSVGLALLVSGYLIFFSPVARDNESQSLRRPVVDSAADEAEETSQSQLSRTGSLGPDLQDIQAVQTKSLPLSTPSDELDELQRLAETQLVESVLATNPIGSNGSGFRLTQGQQAAVAQFGLPQSPLKVKRQSDHPDVILVEVSPNLPHTLRQNQFVNLTELWQQAGLLEALPASFQDLSAVDGQQYYLPLATTWAAIYYNKAIFAQYNLTPPQTWDQFLTLCQNLLAQGVTPLSLSLAPRAGWLWFDYLNLRLNGPEFHRDFWQGQARFDDPRVRLVFETWGSLFKQGCFGSAGGSQTTWQSLAALNPGHNSEIKDQPVAMTLAKSRDMAWFPESFLTEVDFFPFPRINPTLPKAEIIWPYGYAVPAEADHLISVLAFLTYISSVEAQTALGPGLGPTIAPLNPHLEPALLQPGQRQGRSLVYKAETIVVDRRATMRPLMVDRFARVYGRFWRDPDNLEAVLAAWQAE